MRVPGRTPQEAPSAMLSVDRIKNEVTVTAVIFEKQVTIRAGDVFVEGILTVPEQARACVLFAHGSGSSRLSPRNKFVADVLIRAGFATLLFDLLTPAEDAVYENRFDIGMLTERLKQATRWIQSQPRTTKLALGYVGASTGTASALKAAAELGTIIRAVVSRGGRPDLAGDALSRVAVPVLLIVGGSDELVIDLNRQAERLLGGKKEIAIVPGATHLFEEPGALARVAELASAWFKRYLLD